MGYLCQGIKPDINRRGKDGVQVTNHSKKKMYDQYTSIFLQKTVDEKSPKLFYPSDQLIPLKVILLITI